MALPSSVEEEQRADQEVQTSSSPEPEKTNTPEQHISRPAHHPKQARWEELKKAHPELRWLDELL